MKPLITTDQPLYQIDYNGATIVIYHDHVLTNAVADQVTVIDRVMGCVVPAQHIDAAPSTIQPIVDPNKGPKKLLTWAASAIALLLGLLFSLMTCQPEDTLAR